MSFYHQQFLVNCSNTNDVWNILTAIGTLGAVAVAIFIPTISSLIKKHQIERAIFLELESNYKTLKEKEGDFTINIEGELPIDVKNYLLKFGKIQIINIRQNIWYEYRQQLAEYSPEKYKKYGEFEYRLELLNEKQKEFKDYSDSQSNLKEVANFAFLEGQKLFITEYEKQFINKK